MLKRAFDVTVAAIGLLVCAPLLLLISVGVRIMLGRPVLFRQVRPGFQGQPFTMMKFRTMTQDPHGGVPLSDAQRLTPFGRFLRRTSLDELPELVNVIRGEMSLVGPRPLLMEYLSRYSTRQARRHEVRPGITGLAQISGRNTLSWEERLELDVQYVDDHSFVGDVMILCRTLAKVIRADDVSQPGHATAEPFRGNH
jgi:lipopolysaccharide/colanic/teichoic acid biosynthesis glycosyltransferase